MSLFEICLFDLDETLVRTGDLEVLRKSCKNQDDQELLGKLRTELSKRAERHVYSKEILSNIRSEFPRLKLGVFTRSPRSYALAVLEWAYPGFEWDIVVAYEDVKPTKPHGDGIGLAMRKFNVEDLDRVILVGDSDVDVRSAYNCGCLVVLDKSAWPSERESEHWNAIAHVPDAVINSTKQLLNVLANPAGFLPELERLLEEADSTPRTKRFDKINHFIPKATGGDTRAYPIHVSGRSFSNYESVQHRKQRHALTESIQAHKNSDTFPETWIKSIRHFINHQFQPIFGKKNIVITVVPHRPGRKPRLENLLQQLKQSFEETPLFKHEVTCLPELLAYKEGVKSQHNDYLDRDQRFINVRDHLCVQQPEKVKAGVSFIVIDDVTTTGASLIYAAKYLQAAGAQDVQCLSLAKNISNVL